MWLRMILKKERQGERKSEYLREVKRWKGSGRGRERVGGRGKGRERRKEWEWKGRDDMN